MKLYIFPASLLAIFLSLTLNAFPATYYVKNGGNDINTGLSDAKAWATINKVNSFSFNPGDDVYFKCGGTFSDTNLKIGWSGTNSNQVIIGAYYMEGGKEIIGTMGNKPVIDGNFKYPSEGPKANIGLVQVRGQSYVTIQDLRIIRSKSEGLELSGNKGDSDQKLRAYRIETYRSYNSGAAIWGAVKDVIVNDCIFEEDVYLEIVNPPGKAAGVQIVPPASRGGAASKVTFQNNVVKESYGECMNIAHSEDLFVQDNQFYNNKRNVCINIVAHWSNENPVHIRRNLLYQTPVSRQRESGYVYAFYIGDGNHYRDTDKKGVNNVYIYDNLIAGFEGGVRFHRNRFITTTFHDNVHFYNNTFVDCNIMITFGTTSFIDYGDNIYFTKNIFHQTDECKDCIWLKDNGGDAKTVNWDYNLWTTTPNAALIGPNDPPSGDPLLAKSSGWRSLSDGSLNVSEFALRDGSPAIYADKIIGAYIYNKNLITPPCNLSIKKE